MAKKCKPNWKDLPKEVANLKEQIEQCCEQPSEQTTINGKSGNVVIEAGEGIDIDNSGDSIVISSTGDEGIQSIVAGDNISIDDTDPSNPIISVSGIVMPEQYFVEITQGSNTGYASKFRIDNPNYYSNIGNRAIDLSFATSETTRGASGNYSTVSGGVNNTASDNQSTVSGGSGNTASGNQSTVSGGGGNTASGAYSTISGGRNNTANSFASWFGGQFSTLFTGQSITSWVSTDILFNIGNGTNINTRSNALSLFKNGRLELPSYGDGTFTGTATKLLAVDADGKVIEEDLPTQTVKQAKVTVTPEQMLDLVDNPVELIPAQGANTVIIVIGGSMFLDFNSVAYDFGNGRAGLSVNGNEVSSLRENVLNSSANAAGTIGNINSSINDVGFNNPLLLQASVNATQGDSPVTFIIDYVVHNYN